MENKNTMIAMAVAAALIIAGAAFYGGMKYQSFKDSALAQSNLAQRRGGNGGNFMGGAGGGRNGNGNGGGAAGEIIAKDDKSITIKLRDGGSKIIFYSASTQLQKMAEAVQSDFAVGGQIIVNGTANSDGSIVAKQIQLRSDFQPSPSPSEGE